MTFAYLTDMYVLKGYHGTGLGTWVMSCVDEVIRNWPHLRRFVFLTADKMDFYRKTLGAKDFLESEAETATFGIVEGPAAKHPTV